MTASSSRSQVWARGRELLDPLDWKYPTDTETLVAEARRWVFDPALHRMREEEVRGCRCDGKDPLGSSS